MLNMDQIIDNFIGSSAENETATGNYGTERLYINWLISNCLGEGTEDEYDDEKVQEVFEQKYCQGYKLDEFCGKFVTKHTIVNVNGKRNQAETLATRNGGPVWGEYILLEQAMPGDEYDAAGKQIACFTAPAIRLGDYISELGTGTAPRYTVVWDIVEGYQNDDELDLSEACDWDNPREVYKNGFYDVQEGRFC